MKINLTKIANFVSLSILAISLTACNDDSDYFEGKSADVKNDGWAITNMSDSSEYDRAIAARAKFLHSLSAPLWQDYAQPGSLAQSDGTTTVADLLASGDLTITEDCKPAEAPNGTIFWLEEQDPVVYRLVDKQNIEYPAESTRLYDPITGGYLDFTDFRNYEDIYDCASFN